MLGWLKKKGMGVVQNQCKFNIKLCTKTLISIANRAHAHLEESGGKFNEYNKTQVNNAQERLAEEIGLGIANGLTLDEIKTGVIQPILEESDVTAGASLAVNHVIESAEKIMSLEKPAEVINESETTIFFQGNVSIVNYDYETTDFRLVENNAVVRVRNETHLRLVEDISKLHLMPHFEIIAPMTAVKVVEGQIPESCLHEYTLNHYLALRRHYTGT